MSSGGVLLTGDALSLRKEDMVAVVIGVVVEVLAIVESRR